jgi:hypothetical protein
VAVFIVHLTCSDVACAEELEAVVETLEEIDEVLCECGCCTALVTIAELDASSAPIELRRVAAHLPLAA